MNLAHERLDAYYLSLDFLVLADQITKTLPLNRTELSEQLSRASTSIVLNLAEAAGKASNPEKRRHFLNASGCASESAALLDVCARLSLLNFAEHNAGKQLLVSVVSMLATLSQSLDD